MVLPENTKYTTWLLSLLHLTVLGAKMKLIKKFVNSNSNILLSPARLHVAKCWFVDIVGLLLRVGSLVYVIQWQLT